MKDKKYEEITARIMQEAQSMDISEQTAKEALLFMGDILPTITDYNKDIRLAVFGIACYSTGKGALNNEQI